MRLRTLTASLLLASGAVFAAEEPLNLNQLDLEDLLKLEVATITAASRSEEKATDAPSTVVVISDREIRARGYQFLEDVLRDVPGFETQEYSQAQNGTSVSVRGLIGNNAVVVLLNGMRVSPPGGIPMAYKRDFYIGDAEQVEIVYGAGSTMYGQDATGAVINVKTRAPDGTRTGSLSVQGGLPARFLGTGVISKKFEGGSVYGWVAYGEGRPTDVASRYPEEHQDYVKWAQPRGGTDEWRYDRGLSAFGRLEVGDTSLQLWHRESMRPSADAGPPQIYRGEEAQWRDRSTAAELSNRLRLGKRAELQTSLSLNRYELDPSTTVVLPNGPSTWDMDAHYYERSLNVMLDEKLSLHPFDNLSLIAGVSGSLEDDVSSAQVHANFDPSKDLAPQFKQVTYFTRPGDPTSATRMSSGAIVSWTNLAGYVEAAYRPFEKLRVVAGLRVDRNSHVTDTPLSPRASVVFQPTKELELRYAYAQAFVAPQLQSQYLASSTPTFVWIPAPSLEPERAYDHEISATWHSESLQLTAAGYLNRMTNLFSVQPTGQTAYYDPYGFYKVNVFQDQNLGESRYLGADFLARYNLRKLSLWAGYSYVDVRTETAGVVTGRDQISGHNYRLGATASLLDGLYATLGFVTRSRADNVAMGPYDAPLLSNPYELNAYVTYAWKPGIDVFAEGRNLTNHRYVRPGAFAYHAAPGEAIRGSAGVRVTF